MDKLRKQYIRQLVHLYNFGHLDETEQAKILGQLENLGIKTEWKNIWRREVLVIG